MVIMDAAPHLLPLAYLGGGVRLDHIHDPPGLIVEPHHHLYHEFDYVLGGRGVFAVGARKAEVGPGDAVYLARGVYHRRLSDPDQPLELCNLVLEDGAMRALLDTPLAGGLVVWPWWRHWPAAALTVPDRQVFLGRLVRRMAKGPQYVAPSDLKALLPGLGRLLASDPLRLRAAHPALPRLARRMRWHPEAPLSLDAEAARMGVSRWWLSRTFRVHFGVTLWEFRDYARTDMAIDLLLKSDLLVRDLARRVGFAGQAQFINTFKRLVGVTPNRLRRLTFH